MSRSKFTCFILILSIIISLFAAPMSFAADETDKYYEKGYFPILYNENNSSIFQNIKNNLPLGTTPTIIINGDEIPFNYRIWFAKNIVVYGDYSICNPRPNDFKAETASPYSEGYYMKNGVRGEYRYHGFDIAGNLYSNTWFTIDEITTSSINDNKWLYRPWDKSTYAKVNISPYNESAEKYESAEDIKTRSWINRPIKKDSVTLTFENAEKPEIRDAHSYIHIMSPPSISYPGEGKAWYLYNNYHYYRTFTLDKLSHTDKLMTDVEASLEILTPKEQLVVIDYGKDNTAEYLNAEVEVKIKVIGTLLDDEYYNDPVKKTARYTRYDIRDWDISLGTETHKNLKPTSYNKSESIFTIKMKRAAIIDKQKWLLSGKAKVNFINDRQNEKSSNIFLNFSVMKKDIPQKQKDDGNKKDPEPNPNPHPEPEPNPPHLIVPNCNIPEIGYDVVHFPASDNTNLKDVVSRTVYINGDIVNDKEFFSGKYIFGDGNHGLKRIDVFYESIDGTISSIVKWVQIYDTKPNAQFKINGTFKQNRKLTVTENSDEGNVQLVIEKYPIVSYEWKFMAIDGDDNSLRIRNLSDTYKEFMYKKPGAYQIQLTVTNSIGRKSKPYILDFIIYEDIAPAIEMNIWNGVLTRNEELNQHYFVTSVDKDEIAEKTLEIFYDHNNDGVCDKLVKSFPNGEFTGFVPDKLGKYKIVATAVESFGQDTLSEYVEQEDIKTKVIESEFLVDNLAPMTDIYINIPVVRPEVDLYIMLDKSLNSSTKQYITSNRINFNNYLNTKNLLSQIQTWDMKTYEYSEWAYDSYHTSVSYPPNSISYSSGGYSGTLSLESVSDNGKNVDKGSYKTISESKTFYGEHNNIVTDIYYDGKLVSSRNSSLAPSTYQINEDGYSGSIPRIDTRQDWQKHYSNGTMEIYETSFTAIYEGTLTKETSVWEPDIKWVSDYIGYYKGRVYKSTRQTYTDPFRPKSNKYVVYVSDSIVNEIGDLRTVMGKSDAKLILVGSEQIKNQINYQHYLSKDNEIELIMKEVLDFIAKDSPAIEKHYVLAGIDNFNIKSYDFDLENDEIVERKFQYIHYSEYYDNPTGIEDFTSDSFSEDNNWIDKKLNIFHNVGEYRVFRRIKDKPTNDPNFTEYSYYSGTPELRIYAHRKPIAKLKLDWDYDSLKGVYKTSWVCDSYDLDHQFSREDKGIVDRKIMFRKNSGEWYYYIPDELSSGKYELKYFVKDVEGAWSEPFIMNFTLSASPDIQFLQAKMRAKDSSFNASNIPASEYLELYDICTRYPYNLKLEIASYKGNNKVDAVTTINFNSSTGRKENNDIFWNNISYQIPENLRDGTYDLKIAAVDTNNSTNKVEKSFPFTVQTPIDLIPNMPESIIAGNIVDITATTKKYADSTRVDLFYGTSYQKTITLTEIERGTNKEWSYKYTIPLDIPEGTYTARFSAVAPSGKTEVKDLTFKTQALKITDVTIEGYWNHWRGQKDLFGTQLTNEPHRFLSLERVKVRVKTDGYVDKVQIRFSPELEAMQYIDDRGREYDYKEDFRYDHVIFPKTFELDGNQRQNQIYWEYVLPLAKSTKSWENKKLRNPYYMEVTAWRGETSVKYIIDDIDITGNIHDLTYIQPK